MSETSLYNVQVPRAEAQSTLLDYFLPIWPTLACFTPTRTDGSTVTPSSGFNKYFAAVTAKSKQFAQTGLFFTGQCALRAAFANPFLWLLLLVQG